MSRLQGCDEYMSELDMCLSVGEVRKQCESA